MGYYYKAEVSLCKVVKSRVLSGQRTQFNVLRSFWIGFMIFIELGVGRTTGTPNPSTSFQNNTSRYLRNNQTRTSNMPYFADVTRREIEAYEGQTLVIPCTVRNLSRDKVVSWIRTKDLHILTSGTLSFSSDSRFEPMHTDSSGDFWGLRIKEVKMADSGQYECQVNTDPKISLAVRLSVSNPESTETSKWLGKAKINAPKEVFVQNGSPLTLTCQITPILDPKVLEGVRVGFRKDVWWLHENTQIYSEAKDSRISIKTTFYEDRNTLYSDLRINYVSWQDEGTYACMQPSVKKDFVKLIVVEAESSEAMQRDYPVMSSNSSKTFVRLRFAFFLILCSKIWL